MTLLCCSIFGLRTRVPKHFVKKVLKNYFTHLVVPLPEDVRGRVRGDDDAGQVEAGAGVHVELALPDDLRAGLCRKKKKRNDQFNYVPYI